MNLEIAKKKTISIVELEKRNGSGFSFYKLFNDKMNNQTIKRTINIIENI